MVNQINIKKYIILMEAVSKFMWRLWLEHWDDVEFLLAWNIWNWNVAAKWKKIIKSIYNF